MREMHKWKDKIEFSLDNRQIFFLFFGLSVMGCFVFVLGVMAGKKVTWESDGRVASVATADSLDMLEDDLAEDGFEFREGLAVSEAEDVPPTRDPSVPPRSAEEIEEDRRLAAASAVEDDEDEIVLEDEPEDAALAAAAPIPAAVKAPTPTARPAREAAKDAVMNRADDARAKPAPSTKKAARRFTLQLKAFSRAEDAEKLAAQLRSNGHQMRIDTADVKGRTWHRVRMGAFDSWNEALEAKTTFEKREHIIAYVMAM